MYYNTMGDKINKNYHIIFKVVDFFWKWTKPIYRILVESKVYYYNLFVDSILIFSKFLPLRSYMNNTGFKL